MHRVLVVLLALGPLGPTVQDRWAEAEAAIVRLAPSAVQRLPAPVVRELEARGCTIPQITGHPRAHNFARGEFLAPGRKTWAVLCSVGGASAILVFDKKARVVAELAREPDRNYLQGLGGKKVGYSRFVTAATPAHILEHLSHSDVEPGTVPEITHDGIEDAFEGKASTVHYFVDGRWTLLPGAD